MPAIGIRVVHAGNNSGPGHMYAVFKGDGGSETTFGNVLCWRRILRSPVKVTFTSAVELGRAMRRSGGLAYERVPYLPGRLPKDGVIRQEANAGIRQRGGIRIAFESAERGR